MAATIARLHLPLSKAPLTLSTISSFSQPRICSPALSITTFRKYSFREARSLTYERWRGWGTRRRSFSVSAAGIFLRAPLRTLVTGGGERRKRQGKVAIGKKMTTEINVLRCVESELILPFSSSPRGEKQFTQRNIPETMNGLSFPRTENTVPLPLPPFPLPQISSSSSSFHLPPSSFSWGFPKLTPLPRNNRNNNLRRLCARGRSLHRAARSRPGGLSRRHDRSRRERKIRFGHSHTSKR